LSFGLHRQHCDHRSGDEDDLVHCFAHMLFLIIFQRPFICT
jgi:hypothetical protein